jgi:GNAT superfamily N-acetyltransferase
MTLQTARRLFTVEEWTPIHPSWNDLLAAVEAHAQTDWVSFTADFHISSHMLVVLHSERIAGFLRYVVQQIGPDMGCPPVTLGGKPLTEAKVLAFAVDSTYRRKGFGRALQEDVVRRAREAGCYQVRSHSSGSNEANHRLKLSMGFGIHPIVRGDDSKGAYFILPLDGAGRAETPPN